MQQLWLYTVLGLTTGGAYALTSVGLVTVYRGSGVLNLAHGAFGMVGTYVFYELWNNLGLPVSLALPLGIASGTAVGLIAYALVMRPLQAATDFTKVIATLGMLLLLSSLATVRYGVNAVLVPPFLGQGSFSVFGAPLLKDTSIVILTTILLALLLSYMFRRSRLGLAATALYERPVAAQAVGISPHPTGLITWGIGGALAAAAGIVLLPVTGLSPSQLTAVVFPALAAGLLGRFRNYPVAIGASFVIGILQSVLVKYEVNQGIIQSLPFAVIIVALVLGGTAVPGRGATELRLPRVASGNVPLWLPVLLAIGTAVLLLVLDTGWSVAFVSTAIVGLIGISLVVVTGFAGQISLAPFAVLGLTSLAAVRVSDALDFGFLPSLLVGIVSGCVIGFVVGLPAVRVRGLDLAVVTLGIALMVDMGILNENVFVGNISGLPVRNPEIFGWAIDPATHPQRYALAALVILMLVSMGVITLRKSRGGRRLLAVRGNERGAAAIGISVVSSKLAGFALSGGIIGLAGVLISFRFPQATFDNYDYMKSVIAVTFTVVGGIGFIGGGIFAGAATSGGVISNFFINWQDFPSWAGVAGGAAVITILLSNADGEIPRLIGLAQGLLARLRPAPPPVSRAAAPDRLAAPSLTVTSARTMKQGDPAERREAGAAGPLLTVSGLTVRHGSVTAVNAVDLEVRPGRVLGVVGPNGAGKTSLIDAIHGFAPIASGRVELEGRDLAGLGAVQRARRGLARTFQNLELFQELTVRENLLAASDSRDVLGYAVGFFRSDRSKVSDFTRDIVDLLGLNAVLEEKVERLPSGQQHLVALARSVCARPKVLSLDEPTAGLAGGERGEVVNAIRTLAERTDTGFLIIEHNLDVIESLCDDLVVLSFGEIIAAGEPGLVLRSDVVRHAYLGTASAVPIARDGSS